MAPTFKGGRGRGSFRSRGTRGRGRGGGEAFTQKRSHFKTSRLEEDKDDSASDHNKLPDGGIDDDTEPSEDNSDNENEGRTTNSYAALLQALKAEDQLSVPARKKRKLSRGESDHQAITANGNGAHSTHQKNGNSVHGIQLDASEKEEPPLVLEEKEPEDDNEDLVDDEDGEGEDAGIFDPYQRHFAYAEGESLTSHLAIPLDKRWKMIPPKGSSPIRTTTTLSSFGGTNQLDRLQSPSNIRYKKRLSASAGQLWKLLDVQQKEIAGPILQYWDVVSGARSVQNTAILRDVVALHALDHVFKTRDHIIKNNTKLAQVEAGETLDLRDQGFTRPKVLFLLPTRQACVRLVDSIVSICKPEQQENKARFLASFGGEEDNTWADRPEDFQELFAGNDDDMFRIGLKFTRKTVKYFAAFYSSDIIIASPLGLRNAIENSGGGKDKETKKGHDADFLSSIEIVTIDHANALQMQNWEHVEYIFSQLNLLPREAHGCDFSRVRPWYLDGHARHLRQTIVLSDFITPEINALASTHMLNIAGKIKYTPFYKGAMLDLPPTLPSNITQTFSRFDSLSPAKDPEARFQHFISTILPSLVRDRHLKGTLIFIPSSFDFIRLRNHFATSNETTPLSFGAISEYTSVRDVMRARSHFVSERHGVLLYSERAHHFRRYALKGVRRIIFYGVPENPIFWGEIVGFLGLTNTALGHDGGGRDHHAGGGVKALCSRWDVLKLERIVGTQRFKRLAADRGGDTFEFV